MCCVLRCEMEEQLKEEFSSVEGCFLPRLMHRLLHLFLMLAQE